MAEVIKHGCIKDAELFDLLEAQSEVHLYDFHYVISAFFVRKCEKI